MRVVVPVRSPDPVMVAFIPRFNVCDPMFNAPEVAEALLLWRFRTPFTVMSVDPVTPLALFTVKLLNVDAPVIV